MDEAVVERAEGEEAVEVVGAVVGAVDAVVGVDLAGAAAAGDAAAAVVSGGEVAAEPGWEGRGGVGGGGGEVGGAVEVAGALRVVVEGVGVDVHDHGRRSGSGAGADGDEGVGLAGGGGDRHGRTSREGRTDVPVLPTPTDKNPDVDGCLRRSPERTRSDVQVNAAPRAGL